MQGVNMWPIFDGCVGAASVPRPITQLQVHRGIRGMLQAWPCRPQGTTRCCSQPSQQRDESWCHGLRFVVLKVCAARAMLLPSCADCCWCANAAGTLNLLLMLSVACRRRHQLGVGRCQHTCRHGCPECLTAPEHVLTCW
jgi:hypothetical protein